MNLYIKSKICEKKELKIIYIFALTMHGARLLFLTNTDGNIGV